jgi:hypothetical protein
MSNAAAVRWLQLEGLVAVSASSEHPAHPISAILEFPPQNGWRAAEPGEQWVRITFTSLQPVNHLRLVFRDAERERTQQFTVRWWPGSYQDVIRQQFDFSPDGAVEQVENYSFNLSGVTGFEVRIIPDISDLSGAFASVAELQIA